jgi:hypothetical protein
MILTYFNGGHGGALDTIYIYFTAYVLNVFHSLTSCILYRLLKQRREVTIVSDSDCPKPRPSQAQHITSYVLQKWECYSALPLVRGI